MIEIEPATVPCPHCGGAIKSAARICKHCKRPAGPAPTTTVDPGRGIRAPVVDALRSFLLGRALAAPHEVDAALARSTASDAAVVLGEIAAAGALTPIQVESVRESFRLDQQRKIQHLLDAGAARGLLLSAHVAAALRDFDGVLFSKTAEEFLVEQKMLTRAQVDAANSASAPALRGRVGALWRRAISDPTWRNPLAAGPLAMFLVAPVALVISHVGGQAADGAVLLLLFMPIFAVLAVAWRGNTAARRVAWAASTFGTGVLALFLFSALGVGGSPPPVVAIEPHCTMDGTGRGECVFTNLEPAAGVSCGQVVAECHARNGSSDTRSSEPLCSGRLRPGDTRRMHFTVADFDRIRDRVVPAYGDWRNSCSFTWEPR